VKSTGLAAPLWPRHALLTIAASPQTAVAAAFAPDQNIARDLRKT